MVDPARLRDDANVSLKKEIDVLKQLHHKNIIRIIEVIEDVCFSGSWCSSCGCTECCLNERTGCCRNCGHESQCHSQEESRQVTLIVQEFGIGGELFGILQHNGPFSEDIARYYFLDLIKTVYFCHSRGVFHRDL